MTLIPVSIIQMTLSMSQINTRKWYIEKLETSILPTNVHLHLKMHLIFVGDSFYFTWAGLINLNSLCLKFTRDIESNEIQYLRLYLWIQDYLVNIMFVLKYAKLVLNSIISILVCQVMPEVSNFVTFFSTFTLTWEHSC